MKKPALLLAGGFMLGLSSQAFAASVTYLNSVDNLGSGLGAVPTVETLRAQGSGTEEWGTVERIGGVDVVAGSNVTGINQTWTRADLATELGAFDETQFAVALNISETTDLATIILNTFTVRFYTADDGSAYFDAVFTGPKTLDQIAGGLGGQDHVFMVNFDSLAQFNSWVRVGFLIPDVDGSRIENVDDGVESFAFTSAASFGPTPVPLPSTAAAAATLFALLGLTRSRRR